MPVKRRRSSRRTSSTDGEALVEAEAPSPKKVRSGEVSEEEEASLEHDPDAAVFEEVEKVWQESLQRPEAFLQHTSPSAQELALHLRAATKALHDHAKSLERRPGILGPLKELYVTGFVTDQIWEELQLYNAPLLRHARARIAKAEKAGVDGDKEESDSDEGEEDLMEDSGSGEEVEEEEDSNADDSDLVKMKFDSDGESEEGNEEEIGAESDLDESVNDRDHSGEDSDSDSDLSVGGDEYEMELASGDDYSDSDSDSGSEGESKVDKERNKLKDGFFDLNEMEEFVREAEREAEGQKDQDFDEDEEETAYQLMWGGSAAGVVGSNAEEEEAKAAASSMTYSEYFEAPKPTRHQIRQQRMKEKIKKLESANISEKPWQLKGEASATDRPKDSLLEEFVVFDHATKTAPVVTVEKTEELEDMIKRRISEQSWDDVVRKREQDLEDLAPKRLPELDHEKSKVGLGDLYEQEYLKQIGAVEEEDKAKESHQEIRLLFAKLCHKLDALANFHYTPKPLLEQEEEEKKNVPSIQVEEVLPSAVSDGTLLAPEEVYRKTKREIKGKTETTKEERSARRRAKKKAKRAEGRRKEAVERAQATVDPIARRRREQAESDQAVAALHKAKNVKFDKGSDPTSYTQSSAFFAKIQASAVQEIERMKEDKAKAEGK